MHVYVDFYASVCMHATEMVEFSHPMNLHVSAVLIVTFAFYLKLAYFKMKDLISFMFILPTD